MIISHTHKFIFIKTHKTAGTIMELALGEMYGDRDVISSLSKRDEQIRIQNGLRGKQNDKVPLKYYSKKDIINCFQQKELLTFKSHDSALFVKNHIPENTWNSYYKFCFERNPYHKMISWYYFWLRDKDIAVTIDEFIKTRLGAKDDRNLYNINGGRAVDQVYQYEDLDNALIDIAKKIEYKGQITLKHHAKRQFRKDYRAHHEVLSQESIDMIRQYYRSVFEEFNYEM